MPPTPQSALSRPAPSRLAGSIRTALVLGVAAFALPVMAQTSAEADAAHTLDTIQVTGSRIQRQSSNTETAQPISVIAGEVFVERGFTNAAEAVNQLPQVIGSLTDAGDQEGGQTGKQFINLFNLGSERTLTLVNGRRFVSSNAAGGGQGGNQVDLNNIPASLIDRIEVVQATGSAVYGSDAVAGVVNIILKSRFEGAEFDAQTGLSERGDYERHAFSLTGGTGFADGRGSLIVNVDWSKSGALVATDRPWTSRGFTFAPNPANTSGSDGIPASIGREDHRMSEHPEGGTLYIAPAPLAQFRLNIGGGPVRFDNTGSLVPYDVGDYVQPAYAFGGDGLKISEFTAVRTPVERHVMTALGHYDLTDRLRLSAEVMGAEMRAFEPINQGAYNSTLLTTQPSGALRFTTDNPFLSDQARGVLTGAGVSNFWLSRFHTDILPDSGVSSRSKTQRGVLALDGNFEAAGRYFHWNTSANFGRSEGSFSSYGILQQNWLQAIDAVRDGSGNIVCRVALTNPGTACAPLNLFGIGQASQAARDYVTGVFGAQYETRQNNYQVNIGGELAELPAGALNFVAGWEYRKEFSDYRPYETSARGLGRSTPVASMRGEYDTNEFYGELLVPVLGNGVTLGPVTGLEFDASYRTVDNSLAGDNEAVSAGMRLTFLEDLTLRGTWNKTFRAPSLYELFQPRSMITDTGVDPCDSRYINTGANAGLRASNCRAELAALGLDPNAPLNSLITNVPTEMFSGGNTALRNELAESWTAGIVYAPQQIPGLSLELDYVELKIKDAISSFNAASTMQACYDQPVPNAYCDNFARGPDGQIVQGSMQVGFTNAGYVDFGATSFAANYRLPLGDRFGSLDLGLNVMKMRKLLVSVSGLGFDEYDAVGTGLLSSSLVGPTPEYQARFNARWETGPVTVNWNTQWYDSVVYDHSYTIETRDILGVPSTIKHDASVQYALTDRLSLRFIVNNVFDREPPINIAVGAGAYNDLSDVIGRYYFAGVNYRF